ncbi:unnamed protein product, partial [Iphiclides podalirius]
MDRRVCGRVARGRRFADDTAAGTRTTKVFTVRSCRGPINSSHTWAAAGGENATVCHSRRDPARVECGGDSGEPPVCAWTISSVLRLIYCVRRACVRRYR